MVVMTPPGADAAIAVGRAPEPRLKPPPPPPLYISRGDLQQIEAVREAISARAYSKARALADEVREPIARSLALWYYFDAEDPLVDIGDAQRYLNAHTDWPSQSKIQRHAEDRMPETLPADAVLAFFNQRDPLTSDGKMRLASALYASGEQEAAALHIRDAWINDRFTLDSERRFLSAYGGVLTDEDHEARVDRLLWARQVTNARRVFRFLPSAARKRAEARAALLMQAANAGSLYNRLSSTDQTDPGVLHAAVRYYRRARQEPKAVGLARLAPTDPTLARNPTRFWAERQLLMRWALKNRLYTDAYAMAAGHAMAPGSTSFSEAEFNAGWIALRFLDDPARARAHFAALTASVAAPISLARGYYWLGRAAEAERAEDAAAKATAWYEKAAARAYTYYGQLAAEKLGGEATARAFQGAPPATPEEKARFASRPTAQALRMLTEVGDARAFLIFGYHLDDQLETPGEYLELAAAAARIDAPHVTVRAGKAGVRRGVFAPQVSYPTIFVPDGAARFVPAEVILGLSRQESEFNPRAYSRAGARGVMQLMPATAEITARKERLPYRRSALLSDPAYNMTIGSAHLSHLLTDFNGSFPMVFAGYNAGKGRVKQWIEAYGDPRSAGVDPIDWVEQIPFSETRNYVQRVLENVQVYRSQLAGTPLAGALSRDLERGGPTGRAGTKPPQKSTGLTPDVQARIAAIGAPVLAAPPPASESAADAPAAAQVAVGDANGDAASGTTAPEPMAANPVATDPVMTDKDKRPEPARTDVQPVKPSIPAKGETNAELPSLTAPTTPETTPETTPDMSENGSAGNAGEADGSADTPAGAAEQDASAANECLSYTAYMAAASPEEASAADLNAGMLAELSSGGPICPPRGSTSPRQ